ncbi:MAG: winged helix-turn-helix domain-containing protein [Pseudomonadota bacterium]|nr:winged helix-turn-helix domain-containing protein [Pseudomonadota bacterium]
MIYVDTPANITSEPQVSKSPLESLTCLTIRTGNVGCIARFYPALYQLTLVQNGVEDKIDLGFSGSRLLERLVRSPGEVVDRDELMSHAWSGRVVGQGSLNQQIYTLRQILNDEKAREIIQTLPRRGYLINPNYVDISLEMVAPAPPDEVEQATPATSGQQKLIPVPSRWNLSTIVATIALLGVVSLLVQGTSIFGNQNASTNTAPKLLTITYSSHSSDELAQLLPLGEDLNRRLAPNLTQPLHLIIGHHETTLDVVCLRADGSARTLHIDQDKVSQLTDADLAGCLP